MLLTVAKVMVEIVVLVFEGIEYFVFNLPPATANLSDSHYGIGIDRHIGHPAEGDHLSLFRAIIEKYHVGGHFLITSIQFKVKGIANLVCTFFTA